MLEKDAILSKISIIKNCLRVISNLTKGDPTTLQEPTTQDLFVLNLQRAVQAAIDGANLLIAARGFGLPASYKDSFAIIQRAGVIDLDLGIKMQKMCGFRNIAIHDYRKIELVVLQAILTKHLTDLEEFCAALNKTISK